MKNKYSKKFVALMAVLMFLTAFFASFAITSFIATNSNYSKEIIIEKEFVLNFEPYESNEEGNQFRITGALKNNTTFNMVNLELSFLVADTTMHQSEEIRITVDKLDGGEVYVVDHVFTAGYAYNEITTLSATFNGANVVHSIIRNDDNIFEIISACLAVVGVIAIIVLHKKNKKKVLSQVETTTKVVDGDTLITTKTGDGKTITINIDKNENKVNTCPYCGCKVKESDVKCSNCGAKL